MTTATLTPPRPAHTREQFLAPTPVLTPAAAAAPTPAHSQTPTPARSSSPAPRTRHPYDDSDLSPWRAPAHPVPLPASSNPDSNPDAPNDPTSSLAEPITPMQRWAHDLVLEMIRAQLPLEALAAQLGIPFSTLITYLHLPEVQAEINAYEELLTIRARLLGQTARPVSLRKLLDILESPAPRLTHGDPEADQRTLHRHAELIRRTATTITRESRALAPKPVPGQKSAQRTANVSERVLSSDAPLPSQPVHPAGVLPDLPPASSLKDDADSPDAEDAPRCASPDTVDAPRQLPTGSTDPANPSAHAPQPAPAPAESSSSSPSSSPSAPSPHSPSARSSLSSPRPSAALRVESESPPRSSSRHARDRPAA